MNDIIINFDDPHERSGFLKMTRAFAGKMRCSFKRFRERRSDAQNAYYWGVVLPNVAAGIEEAWGEQFSSNETHEYLKAKFLGRPVVNRSTGVCTGYVVDSSALLDTKQFAIYLDKIIRFAAEDLNTAIPEASCNRHELLHTRN